MRSIEPSRRLDAIHLSQSICNPFLPRARNYSLYSIREAWINPIGSLDKSLRTDWNSGLIEKSISFFQSFFIYVITRRSGFLRRLNATILLIPPSVRKVGPHVSVLESVSVGEDARFEIVLVLIPWITYWWMIVFMSHDTLSMSVWYEAHAEQKSSERRG